MKPFLKNSLLFLLVFFILEKGFYYFLNQAPKLEYDTRLEQVLEGKMNKEIIILGSSRGADNILASQIEKETGLSTYNLSYQGADIIFQYFILKSLLKYNQQPKKIVLSIDNPYEFDIEESLQFRIDRLQPLTKYNYINNELIHQKEHNIFSKVFCLSRLNQDQIMFNSKKKTSKIPIDAYGSMPLFQKKDTTVLVFGNSKTSYLQKNENQEKVKAFKNIQQLCKINNIELNYIFSPSFSTFNTAFYNRFTKEVEAKNKIMVYDSLNPIYKNEEYYYDESHLLEKGAKIFTKEIITFIQSN